MKKLLLLSLATATLVALGQSRSPQEQSAAVQQFASRMEVTINTNAATSNVVVTVTLPVADYAILDAARFDGETDSHYIARSFANGVFYLQKQQATFARIAAQQAALMATNSVSTNAP